MGKASRDKGKRGEREWALFLRSRGGFDSARRTGQSVGGSCSPDVVSGHDNGSGFEAFHCEVKRVEKLNIYDAIDQATRDSACKQIPYCAHRKNDCRWLVTVDGEDFMRLMRAYIEDV
jgi:Holliday junction resolvase